MSCCVPAREPSESPTGGGASPAGQSRSVGGCAAGDDAGAHAATMIALPAGTFLMGDDSEWRYPADGESPALPTTVAAFAIDATAVSNQSFAEFVAATGHVTDAERYGWSFVFGGLLPDDFEPTRGVAEAPWWRQVYGATWRAPEGPQSTIADRAAHPAVHITFDDARAYAGWRGVRLPTEAEWEYACRAGSSTVFPWGDDLLLDGRHMMNVFQGEFPPHNTAEDGWAGTCPVDAFLPNAFGLYNMVGNVWEWTADVWSIDRAAGVPADGDRRVMKGGSYLCHASYCRRYRPSARMSSTVDSSSGNVGFRCAVDL